MKKIGISILFVSLLLLGACSEGGQTGSKSVIAAQDFDKMYSNPDKYKSYEVEFTGQVFMDPERDDDGVNLQIWADPKNSEKNMIVAYDEAEFEVQTDDYVLVKGIVEKTFEGENAFGVKMKQPAIKANHIEVIDYKTAMAPTLKTIEVDEKIDQHGFFVHIEKVELNSFSFDISND